MTKKQIEKYLEDMAKDWVLVNCKKMTQETFLHEYGMRFFTARELYWKSHIKKEWLKHVKENK